MAWASFALNQLVFDMTRVRSALLCLVFALAESDARYGSFDFRAAHAGAPADLQELLDQHESLVSACASVSGACPIGMTVIISLIMRLLLSPSGGEGTSAMGC